MHDRVGRTLSFKVCRLTLVGLLAGHGIAAAQDEAPSPNTNTAKASASYPPCDHTPTDGDIAGAKGAFQAGAASFDEADYERAINYWEDAFHRDCTATPLLLNLARAYESSLQYANAIVALKTFNERSPDSPQTTQIQRRIERLQEQLDAQNQHQAPAAAPIPESHSEPAPSSPPAKSKPVQQPKPDQETSPNKTALYVSIAGGGVAVLSGLLYLKERHDVKDFADKCGADHKSCPDDATAKKAEKARNGAIFFGWTTGVGAAVGVAGLVWYLIDSSGSSDNALLVEPERTVRVTPTLLPNFAGLSLDGHFAL